MSDSLQFDLRPAEALDDLCRRYGIKELALFGSIERDDFRGDSDIDVLVEFQPGGRNGLFAFVRLQRELQDLLGRPVDLVPKDGLKSIIREHVINSSRIIYAP